jgi:sortase A
LRRSGEKPRDGEGAPEQTGEPAEELVIPPSGGGKRRRAIGWLGIALAVLGGLIIVYATVVFLFGDPITGLYHDWRQHQMARQLDRTFARFERTMPKKDHRELSPAKIRAEARSFAAQAKEGQPIGRLQIPSIHVSEIVVNGTRWAEDLSRGPGRYPQSSFPGLGKVTAIAGHRTTFGAPFRHIDQIKVGDRIILRMPYGTFVYLVFDHKVVPAGDWSILRRRGFEELVLSACHPLYSASHRWIVFSRLISVARPSLK